MPTYSNSRDVLTPIKEIKFKLEKDLQALTEKNLQTIFDLDFVSTEYALNGFRIDTLAFDKESKAFVIIEYKRSSSFSVVDQGYAYLSLMLNNKAEFLLEYNEKNKKSLRRDDVDWSQSRVIFVADSFSAHQKGAINFKDIPIELWEVRQFENNTVSYSQLTPSESSESIKMVSKSETVQSVSSEVQKFSIDDHFPKGYESSREIFEELKDEVLSLDSQISVSPVKHYIGFKLGNTNFLGVKGRKNKIICEIYRIHTKSLNDPEKRGVFERNSMKYYGKYHVHFNVDSADDIRYAIFLIKQSLEKVR